MEDESIRNAHRLLIIGLTWPEPGTTAAGVRMLQLLDFFIARGYCVTFASTSQPSDHSMDLRGLGVATEPIQLNDASFDAFVRDLQPEIVLFDRFIVEEQFGWRVAKTVPEALRILDTEDLHSVRKSRGEALRNGNRWTLADWLQHTTAKREIASIYRSDLSLIISSYEMELLTGHLKIDPDLLLHLPFLLQGLRSEDIQRWPEFRSRRHFVCIGNGKHPPNIDALQWLKSEIWPLVRQALPTAEVHCYGAYLPDHVRHRLADKKEGFLLHERAPDIDRIVAEARVALAPLRFGAGLKGKLVTAIRNGTPSVTTTIGREGMGDHDFWDGQIADTAQDFAEAAVNLYTHEKVWSDAQANGVALHNRLFDGKKLGDQLMHRIKILRETLSDHRRRNFIGAMLQHHTMASTEYLGRWIEAKA